MWYLCQCPLWKQEPLSIKNSADSLWGENGDDWGALQVQKLEMFSSQKFTDMIVDCGWFGIQPAE